jgi:hypothetical protein
MNLNNENFVEIPLDNDNRKYNNETTKQNYIIYKLEMILKYLCSFWSLSSTETNEIKHINDLKEWTVPVK